MVHKKPCKRCFMFLEKRNLSAKKENNPKLIPGSVPTDNTGISERKINE
jgi:hypothetical protein